MGKQLSYDSYVDLQTLLSCQRPLTPREDGITWSSERFFIVCHQTSELWSSQIENDLAEAAALAVQRASLNTIQQLLMRAASLAVMLCRGMEQVLYCCPKEAFMRFRSNLGGASAAQSRRLRALMAILDGECRELQLVESAVARWNSSSADPGPDRAGSLRETRETIRRFKRAVTVWRDLHVYLVQYFIADLPGTGGTSGVAYLLRRAAGATDTEVPHLRGGAGMHSLRLDDLTCELAALEKELRALQSSQHCEQRARDLNAPDCAAVAQGAEPV